jgi:hypothetical protein
LKMELFGRQKMLRRVTHLLVEKAEFKPFAV